MRKRKTNRNAVALGRLGASKGGFARAARLTPEERSESARQAVLARWKRSHPTEGAVGEGGATYAGEKPAARSQSQADRVARVLNAWLRDDSGHDERTFPKLKRALERARLSSRRLFDG